LVDIAATNWVNKVVGSWNVAAWDMHSFQYYKVNVFPPNGWFHNVHLSPSGVPTWNGMLKVHAYG